MGFLDQIFFPFVDEIKCGCVIVTVYVCVAAGRERVNLSEWKATFSFI